MRRVHGFPTRKLGPDSAAARPKRIKILGADRARKLAAVPDNQFEGMLGQTKGLEVEQGGVELRADWFIDISSGRPILRRAPQPFKPGAAPNMQQVRVKSRNEVFGKFEYLFQSSRPVWEPLLENEDTLIASGNDRDVLSKLNLIPPEDNVWFRVRALSEGPFAGTEAYRTALLEASPESGAYVLFSLRRRKRV